MTEATQIVDEIINGTGTRIFVHLKSRSGDPMLVAEATTSRGQTGGCSYPNCGPSFTYYTFDPKIPTKHDISSFTVEVADSQTGRNESHDNGGAGFPLSDSIFPMFALSGQSSITINGINQMQLNLTAAVGEPFILGGLVLT